MKCLACDKQVFEDEPYYKNFPEVWHKKCDEVVLAIACDRSGYGISLKELLKINKELLLV